MSRAINYNIAHRCEIFENIEDIKRIRPGYGLKPKYYDEVIGKIVTQDVERGDPLTWEIIK